MTAFIPWNSQPLERWAEAYAPGEFVDLDGLSTHYIVAGSGEPLILLHGFFFDTYMWSQSIAAFAEKYRVYALDFWGFGYSTREPLDYGYPLYTRQLRLFMDAMGIPKACLIGQSMGGGTIINFSVSHRERVEKIVLLDAAGLPNPLPIMGKVSNIRGIGELMYGLNSDFIRKLTLGNTFVHDRAMISDKFYENATRFHKIKGSTEVMLYITRKQFFDTLLDKIEALGRMDLPTLIIWGAEEKSIPLETGRRMHELLPGSRFEAIEGGGHCPNFDRPQQFNELVLDFLAADSPVR
jgi:pimeloyl-ACP methyl ester carboxylesterase